MPGTKGFTIEGEKEMTEEEREAWDTVAEGLEETGEYRVIRKLRPIERYAKADGQPVETGLVLDTETTGLDAQADEIIELGMVLFEYAPTTGKVYHIMGVFDELRDPGRRIPPEIVEMTHINDAMVRGRAIDPGAVEAFASGASVVISHNAAFDRPFVERYWDVFARKPWGCSMTQIPWRDEGIATQKQELIALSEGFFYDAHRAVNDCRALLHILTIPLPVSGQLPLKVLLDRAMTGGALIWAIGAPYSAKDMLKERGYRFNNGFNGKPKAWHISVTEEELEAEVTFLDSVYGGDARSRVQVEKMSALDRFSGRS